MRTDKTKMAKRFDLLLVEFESSARWRSRAPNGLKTNFQSMISKFERQVEKSCRRQHSVAADFNLLDVVSLIKDELTHSKVIAWLLDGNPQTGTHAQGNLGFRLFLEEVGLDSSYAQGRYRVRREVSGDNSRIDICVEEPGKFLIFIENKIASPEGPGQTLREGQDLQRRADFLNIPVKARHGLFLHPDGEKPINIEFKAISYRQIASLFDRFAAKTLPEDVRLFTRHYAEGLRRFVIRTTASNN
jgi:hypothetical protein